MVPGSAVVGTATAARNAVNRREADKNTQAYANAMDTAYGGEASAAKPQAVPAAPPAVEEDVITQLERLGALKAQGLLTE